MPLALATRQSHHWQSSLQPSPWHSNKLKYTVSGQGNTSSWSDSWHDSRILKIAETLHHWWPPLRWHWLHHFWHWLALFQGVRQVPLDRARNSIIISLNIWKLFQTWFSSFNWQKMQTSCAPMDVLMLYKANPSRFRTWPRASLMISLSSNSVDSWLQK